MIASFQIRPARTGPELAVVADLLDAYAASLPVDLGYQGFASETAGLPGKYAPPGGELLVAWAPDGRPLGCAALRPLEAEGCCEMKRLFVLPEARGLGLGRAMAEAVIATARALGYRELRLDTLPTMDTAIALYEQMGFRRIAPYGGPMPAGTIFMSLELEDAPNGPPRPSSRTERL